VTCELVATVIPDPVKYSLNKNNKDAASSPGIDALSSDCERLETERDRRIFPPSSSGYVTIDISLRTTGNEAGKAAFLQGILGNL